MMSINGSKTRQDVQTNMDRATQMLEIDLKALYTFHEKVFVTVFHDLSVPKGVHVSANTMTAKEYDDDDGRQTDDDDERQ